MLRGLFFVVAVMLAIAGQASGTVQIWLAETGAISPGSAFPASTAAVPVFEPRVGTSKSFYIWGRPDPGESLINLSLNVVAETQPVCTPTCVVPSAINFTSATIYNDPFGAPLVRRFEFTDDSTSTPPLDISDDRIDGFEGLRIFDTGAIPAVGIGNVSDPLYSAVHNSWLIAAISYDVLLTGADTETRLYLEIGPIGLNHADETTSETSVVFGHAGDVILNGHDDRGIHPGYFDASIRPWRLPGDFNGNGTVEPADYFIWQADFGSTSLLTADHSGNSVVDAADYVIWRKNFGMSAVSSGANAMPEPGAAVLISVALMGLAISRHWRFGGFNS